ncbi:MAG TPA: DUF2127 domain-containing protein [Thermoanaerobaculia bacterium]|jgi:uncharacterized membrane protein (DUF2068 family)
MSEDPRDRQRRPLSAGFIAVIVFKYLKAAAFLLLGIVALRIARLPSHSEPMEIAKFLRVEAEREGVRRLSELLSQVTPGQVQAFGAASVFVGLVFAAEGSFLAARIWWATYFTIFLTALGIPLEIGEMLKRPGNLRVYALFAINVAILVYVWRRRNEFRSPPEG